MAIQLVRLKLITSEISEVEYGIWVQIIGVIPVMITLSSLNLGHAFIRFNMTSSNEHRDTAYFSVLYVQLLASLIVIIFSVLICLFLYPPILSLKYISIISLNVWMMTLLAITNNYLITIKQEVKAYTQNFLIVFLEFIFIGITLFFNASVFSLLIGFTSARIFGIILIFFVNNMHKKHKPLSKQILQKYLRFSLPMLVSLLVLGIVAVQGRYIVRFFSSDEFVAYYSIAERLPSLVLLITTALGTIFFARITRHYQLDKFSYVTFLLSLFGKMFL